MIVHLLLNLILYMIVPIKQRAKFVLISLQFLSPDTDLELRELIMNDEELMKILEAVGFRGVPTSITLETQMDIIRYVSCCSENLSKSLKGEFICILKNCNHTFNCVN